MERGELRHALAVSGHTGDTALARAHLRDAEAEIRVLALGALARSNDLGADELRGALVDSSPAVRRRAVELAAHRPDVSLLGALADADPLVVESAAWASGERDPVEPGALAALIALATDTPDALCREAAVAALGAIGDEAALPAIVQACSDRATVRRRAVLALAPFDADVVRPVLERARADRDWQVRQAAEDLLAIIDARP